MMRIVFVTLYLFIASLSFAQYYTFDGYSLDQGLPHSQAFGVITDYRGCIWAATRGGGITRFNGHEFVTLTVKDGLASNLTLAINKDNQGNIWVVTNQGISKYDGFGFQNFTQPALLGAYAYNKIIHDPASNALWFFLTKPLGTEVWRFHQGTFENLTNLYEKQLKELSIGELKRIAWQQNGRLLLVTTTGLFELSDQNLIRLTVNDAEELQGKKVNLAYPDARGGLWIQAAKAGKWYTYYYLNGTFTRVTQLEKAGIFLIFEDDKQRMWFAANGLHQFDGNNWRHFNAANGFTDLPILEIANDLEGNTWFATAGDGLMKYSGDRFTTFAKDQLVLNVAVDEYQKVWISTYKNGLFTFDGKKENHLINQQLRDIGVLYFITHAKQNRPLFFTNTRNVWELNGTKLNNLGASYGLNNVLMSHTWRENKTLWVTTYDGSSGLIKYDLDTKERVAYTEESIGLSSNVAQAFYKDHQGNYWIGGNNTLDCWDGADRVTKYAIEGVIEQFAETPYGQVWAAVRNRGIYVLNKDQFEPLKYPANQELKTTLVVSLIQADDGHIWAGTGKGLAEITVNESNQVVNVRQYGKVDGIRSSLEMLSGAATKDAAGNLWFGSVKGAVRYKPRPSKERYIPKVQITNVKLFLEDVNWKDDQYQAYLSGITRWNNLPQNLVLPHHRNHLSFDFEGVYYQSSEKVVYRFKLDGLDRDWSPMTSKSEAVYANLPQGKYTFQVLAGIEGEHWSEQPAVFHFEILPAWWQSWWFRVALVLLLLGLVYLGLKYRLKRILNHKKELEKLVEERTVEVVRQRDEIELKSEELKTQTDEILSQNEELSVQQEEILAQRDTLAKQHQELEQKNYLITQSMQAAQRIQAATLPFDSRIRDILKEYFVLYRSREIVSGDFYWIDELDDKIFVVAVDCTGHGVPGAFMSMVANSHLDNIIKVRKLTDPGEILSELHLDVRKALRQGETGNDSGMDVAICVYHKTPNADGQLNLNFAGAKRPLHVKVNQETAIERLKGTHKSIGGKQGKYIEFETHELSLPKGTMLYIGSDGLEDQNNEARKKFGKSRLNRLLEEAFALPAQEQQQLIEQRLDQHMIGTTQRDDILLIGFRL